MPLTLQNFLKYYDMTAQELYKTACLFELIDGQQVQINKSDLLTKINLSGGFYRISLIDDISLLKFALSYLQQAELTPIDSLIESEKQQLLMLYYTLDDKVSNQPINTFFKHLREQESDIYSELLDLLNVCLDKTVHLPKKIDIDFVPLELHASYSGIQALTALGVINEKSVFKLMAGVLYIKNKNLDVFFVTLNKSEKYFSETTQYEDYAIDSSLFHWQSQSRTTDVSDVGFRYVNQRTNGSKVLLFVRENKLDIYGKAGVYSCLGLADYVSHQGSAPISIIYRLQEKMPVRMLRVSNKFVDLG